MVPKQSTEAKEKYRKLDEPSSWRKHDTYPLGVSSSRRVTRSQTAFLRVKNTPSDLELFADSSRHQPPGQPHLMEVMKGKYGSIPRTIITSSIGQHLSTSNDLCEKLDTYKIYKPEKDGEKIEKETPTPPDKEEPKEPARKASSKKLSNSGNLFANKSSSKNADVKMPPKQTVADVETPTHICKCGVCNQQQQQQEPARKASSNVKMPPKQTVADVKTPSKERAEAELPPTTQSEFEIQSQSLSSDI